MQGLLWALATTLLLLGVVVLLWDRERRQPPSDAPHAAPQPRTPTQWTRSDAREARDLLDLADRW